MPQVSVVAGRCAERTIFMRIKTPVHAGDAPGMWVEYYRKWWMMTGDHMQPDMADLVPALKKYVPPARCFDKAAYSPWLNGRLHHLLSDEKVDTLVVSGG